jgi:hypothetical protein
MKTINYDVPFVTHPFSCYSTTLMPKYSEYKVSWDHRAHVHTPTCYCERILQGTMWCLAHVSGGQLPALQSAVQPKEPAQLQCTHTSHLLGPQPAPMAQSHLSLDVWGTRIPGSVWLLLLRCSQPPETFHVLLPLHNESYMLVNLLNYVELLFLSWT